MTYVFYHVSPTKRSKLYSQKKKPALILINIMRSEVLGYHLNGRRIRAVTLTADLASYQLSRVEAMENNRFPNVQRKMTTTTDFLLVFIIKSCWHLECVRSQYECAVTYHPGSI